MDITEIPTPLIELSVDIDFNQASKDWRANKKPERGGYFSYKCMHYSKSKNKHCPKKVDKAGYCRFHYLDYISESSLYLL